MSRPLRELLPATKSETEKAQALVQLGFPAVAPVMPQILEWLQDLNWPVSHVFQPFVASIGSPLAPYIRDVLNGQDNTWKHSLLSGVVERSSELARALRSELEHLAASPSAGESSEEVDRLAADILESLKGGAPTEA